MDEMSGESVVFVDVEDLVMDDDECNENDVLLLNYCFMCLLRSGDEESSMCGFECVICLCIEVCLKVLFMMYCVVVFLMKVGDLEEFFIISMSFGLYTTRRA